MRAVTPKLDLKENWTSWIQLKPKLSKPTSFLPSVRYPILLVINFYYCWIWKPLKEKPVQEPCEWIMPSFSTSIILCLIYAKWRSFFRSLCLCFLQVLSICPKDMRADICVHLNRKVRVCGLMFAMNQCYEYWIQCYEKTKITQLVQIWSKLLILLKPFVGVKWNTQNTKIYKLLMKCLHPMVRFQQRSALFQNNDEKSYLKKNKQIFFALKHFPDECQRSG